MNNTEEFAEEWQALPCPNQLAASWDKGSLFNGFYSYFPKWF